MSAVPSDSSRSSRKIIMIICIILAVLFIVVGLIYAIEPAKSLPSIMGSKAKGTGHHALRMAASFIIGIVFAAAAWIAKAYKPKAQVPTSTPDNSAPVSH